MLGNNSEINLARGERFKMAILFTSVPTSLLGEISLASEVINERQKNANFIIFHHVFEVLSTKRVSFSFYSYPPVSREKRKKLPS